MEDGRAFVLEEGVDEFEQYELNITPGGRVTYSAPSGEHDDVVAAKMLQHWGIVNEGVPDATLIDGVDTSSIDSAEVSHPDDDEMPDEDDWSDYMDEDESELDGIEHTVIEPRSVLDLMNDPAVWSR
jgi:hypothetical protein